MNLITQFTYRQKDHCLIPSPSHARRYPVNVEERVRDHMADNPLDQLAGPIQLPEIDVERDPYAIPQSDLFIMGPTSGHSCTEYRADHPEELNAFIDNQVLAAAWHAIKRNLEALGARVFVAEDIYPPPQVSVPISALFGSAQPIQQIFTRDAGVPIGSAFFHPTNEHEARAVAYQNKDHLAPDDLTFCVQMAQELRRVQRNHLCAAYRQAGKAVTCRPVDAYFEGGDVLYDARKDILFVGHGQDSAYPLSAHELKQLKGELHAETGASVTVIDRPFSGAHPDASLSYRFHLDTFMALLPNGEMLVDPRYTSEQSMNTLQTIYGDNLLRIPKEEATMAIGVNNSTYMANYAPNLVSVGMTLVMPTCCHPLKRLLKQRGYSVVTAQDIGLSPGLLNMRGGSVHCVTSSFPRIGPSMR